MVTISILGEQRAFAWYCVEPHGTVVFAGVVQNNVSLFKFFMTSFYNSSVYQTRSL